MVLSPQGSPRRRSSSISSSINTRIVPFVSHYYSLLGDSPISLIDLHKNGPNLHLKWQIPSCIIGGNMRIQGSTILDNGLISIKSHEYESLTSIFSNLPTINCKIPVEIIDVNETTSEIVTVSIHGHVISSEERYLFFQVLQVQRNEYSFLIYNNIFYVFPINIDLRNMKTLNSQSSICDSTLNTQINHNDFTESSKIETQGHSVNYNLYHNHQVPTFPTYQDKKKTAKVKPQIKIHGLPALSTLTDKDILSAISFQLKNCNEGFAIAIHRTKDEAIVQVDSTHSQELLSQRGIYIKGIKYRVSILNKKNGSNETKHSYSRKNTSEAKQKGEETHRKNSKKEPDSDGWITVQHKSKNK